MKTIFTFTADVSAKEIVQALSQESHNIDLAIDIHDAMIIDTESERIYLTRILDNMSEDKRALLLKQYKR